MPEEDFHLSDQDALSGALAQGVKPWEYKDQDRQPWKGDREKKDICRPFRASTPGDN
jgi:antirestriction protein ArdC